MADFTMVAFGGVESGGGGAQNGGWVRRLVRDSDDARLLKANLRNVQTPCRLAGAQSFEHRHCSTDAVPYTCEVPVLVIDI
jgi:hypothetical protein